MKTQEEKQTELSKRSDGEDYRDRLKTYFQFSGIGERYLVNNGLFTNSHVPRLLRKELHIGVNKLMEILEHFPELNPVWLLTGRESMIQSAQHQNSVHGAVSTILDANKGTVIIIERLIDRADIITEDNVLRVVRKLLTEASKVD